MSNALDDDVLQIFEEFESIPAIVIGHGVGKYEGHMRLTANAPRETLFQRLNIAILAVEKEYMGRVDFLTKINPDLNIFVIDQEELLKFTDEYNSQFYDKSTTDKKNKYYNTECDKTTSESFIKALFNHFKPPLAFSEEVPPVTITIRSIYNKHRTKRNRLCYRLDKVSYCVKGLKQKQIFYNENQIKDAIKKGEKIGDYDPIAYALLHGILLENKLPIIYAMEKNIKIEGIDPTVWAEDNKYDVEEKEPIAYAIEHAIKIEGNDPTLWAHGNGYKIGTKSIDPIVYAFKQFYAGRDEEGVFQYKSIKIEDKDAKEWISNAINNSKKIGDKDAREWLIDAIKEATEKEGFSTTGWRNYPFELVDCAKENNITLEGKPVREWLYDKKAERKNSNKHTKEGAPSPTLDVLAPEENPKPGVKLPDVVISLDGTDEETDTKSVKENFEGLHRPEAAEVPSSSPTFDVPEDDQDPTPEVKFPDEGNDPQKPESNSKYYYIGIGTTVGLAIGLAVAYFAGAADLTPVLAAVAVFIGAAIFSAVLGGVVGACLSNSEVSNHYGLARKP